MVFDDECELVIELSASQGFLIFLVLFEMLTFFGGKCLLLLIIMLEDDDTKIINCSNLPIVSV